VAGSLSGAGVFRSAISGLVLFYSVSSHSRLQRVVALRVKMVSLRMDEFELRPVEEGFKLTGGQLLGSMIFSGAEPDRAIHLVGFLSRKDGSILRIFDGEGQQIEKRRYEGTGLRPEAIGGLTGPD
jgi:hypothetical protein